MQSAKWNITIHQKNKKTSCYQEQTNASDMQTKLFKKDYNITIGKPTCEIRYNTLEYILNPKTIKGKGIDVVTHTKYCLNKNMNVEIAHNKLHHNESIQKTPYYTDSLNQTHAKL